MMQRTNSLLLTMIVSIFLFSVAVFQSCAQTNERTRAQVAWDWIRNKKAVLIDVRTEEEFNAGHLTGAINIPVSMIQGEILNQGTSNNSISYD
jgi:3-mercaptopyruvate sulfurtransferase SseA